MWLGLELRYRDSINDLHFMCAQTRATPGRGLRQHTQHTHHRTAASLPNTRCLRGIPTPPALLLLSLPQPPCPHARRPPGGGLSPMSTSPPPSLQPPRTCVCALSHLPSSLCGIILSRARSLAGARARALSLALTLARTPSPSRARACALSHSLTHLPPPFSSIIRIYTYIYIIYHI